MTLTKTDWKNAPDDPECADVWRFNKKFGAVTNTSPTHLTKRKLAERANFVFEELAEFARASGLSLQILMEHPAECAPVRFVPRDGADQDLAGQADALVDLVYVIKGTAVMQGLPWVELWGDVHGANMVKVLGATKRGDRVDVTKPPGWVGPRTEDILDEAGYRRDDYTRDDGTVDDGRCADDPEPSR